jgi:DNA-binding GntR family transcriptional regulator
MQQLEYPRELQEGATSAAYTTLRRMILSGSLGGGTLMQDRKLAEELGLSRTPVREALHRLEGEGLLERRNRLLFVASVSVQDVLEIFRVRQILEAEATRGVCERMPAATITMIRTHVERMSNPHAISDDVHWDADDLVHLSIARECGNGLLLRLISELRRRTRLFGLYRIPSRFEAGRAEHLAILAAIEAKDAGRAADLMVDHISNARKGVLAALESGSA